MQGQRQCPNIQGQGQYINKVRDNTYARSGIIPKYVRSGTDGSAGTTTFP